MNELEDRINKILILKIKSEVIDANKMLVDYKIDSLDILEIILNIEEEFKIRFSDDELKGIKKISDLYSLVKKKWRFCL